MKLAVLGAAGKMGRAVIRLAHEAGDPIVCAIDATAPPKARAKAKTKGAEKTEERDAGDLAGVGPIGVVVIPDPRAIVTSGADVVIDFSAPAAVLVACEACAAAGVALVSGTTGLGDAESVALDQAAKRCAVLWEPNMSVGVHVLARLVEDAVRALGADYDVEIAEAHHRLKVDAPSGTAIRLADVAARARPGSRRVSRRDGKPGPRDRHEIGVHALRGGDVIGDHTVYLLGDGERLELTHRATSRDLFARGALRAARWIAGRAPGRYALTDVLA